MRDTYLRKVLGADRTSRIAAAKVLLVGAGGIGCELLKNLLLCGFGEIHIVDLDTITLSNLNRQFLFLKDHIDKLKALTVAANAQAFNAFNTRLVPHHGNVMNPAEFPASWWVHFDYIYNALDNLEARRYVNRMVLFLRKPLMEAGTTGSDGQVQPIYPYATECFDCQAKATPMTFPVCTIRSTPSRPVHCVVWAKQFLFQQLFSFSTLHDISDAQLHEEAADDAEIARIHLEANELFELKAQVGDPDFPARVIVKIFDDDVHKACRLELLWKNRRPPQPLRFNEAFRADLERMLLDTANDALLRDDTRDWSVLETLYVFWRATQRLQNRITHNNEPDIAFDKDDEDTLNFVAAAANLRSHAFHIERKFKFDIKQIAGNIIPAIATTNAVISGFSSLISLGFWAPHFSPMSAKAVFLSNKENKRVTSAAIAAPSPKCASCTRVCRAIFTFGPATFDMTLADLVRDIKFKYGYSDEVSVILGQSALVYDCDFDDNAHKKLSELRSFQNNEVLLVQDDADVLENLELLLNVEDGAPYALPDVQLRPKPVDAPAPEPDTELVVATDAGPIEIAEEPPLKRRRVEEIETL